MTTISNGRLEGAGGSVPVSIGSAKPFDLRQAVTLSVDARMRYRFRRLGGVIWEIPVE
jgi:hypothetical protein